LALSADVSVTLQLSKCCFRTLQSILPLPSCQVLLLAKKTTPDPFCCLVSRFYLTCLDGPRFRDDTFFLAPPASAAATSWNYIIPFPFVNTNLYLIFSPSVDWLFSLE